MKDAHLLSSSLNSEMNILATVMWPFSSVRRVLPAPQTTRIRRFNLFLARQEASRFSEILFAQNFQRFFAQHHDTLLRALCPYRQCLYQA
jgi:hypothetical protein